MQNIKIGIIGIGNIGFAHANCIAKGTIEGMELVAVCDTNVEKIKRFSHQYDDVEVFYDYNDMLSANLVDAVIIAVPHPFHAEIAIKALNSGLHIMVEKPADISVSKVRKLNDIASNSGKVFSIMFNQRTNPLFRKAKDLINGGEIGELKRTVWIVTNWFRTQEYYDSGDWRATWGGEGGGVLLNQAPHNLDIWQWICGMPETVSACCNVGKYHNIEVEDDATIFTRYKNGAIGVFITSTGEYPGTNRLEISGSLGKIVLEDDILKLYKLRKDADEVIQNDRSSFVKIDSDYIEIKSSEIETSHKGILQNFANSILFGEELIAPGYEGINELMISNAAYLSSWQGNKEIKLPFDCVEFDKLLKIKINSSAYVKKDMVADDNPEYIERWKVNW